MLRTAFFAALALCVWANPEQRSLALTENGPTEMAVTWASLMAYDATTAKGKVTWQPAAGGSSQSTAAETLTYSSSLGWTGTIFKAVMTGLIPGAAYTYTVSDASGNTTAPQTFNAAKSPSADAALRVAVLGDMGTVQLFGWATAASLIAEHKAHPFDIAVIAGRSPARTIPRQIHSRHHESRPVNTRHFALISPSHLRSHTFSLFNSRPVRRPFLRNRLAAKWRRNFRRLG